MTDFAFALDLDMTIVYTLLAVLGVILIDTLLGIVRALAKGEFDVRLLPNFLRANVFPYVGSLLILAVFAVFIAEIKALLMVAAGFVIPKFLAEIKDKLVDMSVMRKEDKTDTRTAEN